MMRGLLLPCALLALAGALLYGWSVSFDFVHYDDVPLLVDQHAFFANPRNLPRMLTHDVFAILGPESRGVFYRPVLLATYALDAWIGGTSPQAYRVTNVALHLVASGLVLVFLDRLGLGRRRAFLLGLLFCVHPAGALVPLWIPCRNESLLAICVIATLLALIGFLRSGRRALGIVALAGFGVTLLTKESGVVLLGVAPLLVWHERSVRAREAPPGELRWLLVLALGAAGTLVAWALLRHQVLGGVSTGVSRVVDNASMPLVYLGKTFFPFGLSTYPVAGDARLLPGLLASLLVAGLAALQGRRLLGLPGIGLAWYAAFLAPTLLVPHETWGLEHRLYLPLVGMLLFLGSARLPLPARVPARVRSAPVAAVLVVAAAFAWVSFQRTPHFADGTIFWEVAVHEGPSSRPARVKLAWRYVATDRFDRAVSFVDAALVRWPDDADLHLARGTAYGRLGDLERAERDVRRAVDLAPSIPKAWETLAWVQRRRGHDEAAQESFRRWLEAREARAVRAR